MNNCDKMIVSTNLNENRRAFYSHGNTTNISIVITVAGAGGGNGPYGSYGPCNIYNKLADILPTKHNIDVLQVIYTKCSDLNDAICDLHSAINFVIDKGYQKIVLIGWSMGSATIIETVYMYDNVSSIIGDNEYHIIPLIITLAGQSAHTQNISKIKNSKIIIIHGDNDKHLPIQCAYNLYNRVINNNKKLIILQNNDHGVHDAYECVLNYILDALK